MNEYVFKVEDEEGFWGRIGVSALSLTDVHRKAREWLDAAISYGLVHKGYILILQEEEQEKLAPGCDR